MYGFFPYNVILHFWYLLKSKLKWFIRYMDFTNVNMHFSTKKERKLRTLILIHQNPFFIYWCKNNIQIRLVKLFLWWKNKIYLILYYIVWNACWIPGCVYIRTSRPMAYVPRWRVQFPQHAEKFDNLLKNRIIFNYIK